MSFPPKYLHKKKSGELVPSAWFVIVLGLYYLRWYSLLRSYAAGLRYTLLHIVSFPGGNLLWPVLHACKLNPAVYCYREAGSCSLGWCSDYLSAGWDGRWSLGERQAGMAQAHKRADPSDCILNYITYSIFMEIWIREDV